MRPTLFLDFDDVLCLNAPYGGGHIRRATQEPLPADFWPRLFHRPAIETLLEVMAEHTPQIVVTTSWLRFLERQGIDLILRRTGLTAVADGLHDVAWDAPQRHDGTRLSAINEWLKRYHSGEPFVVLDDLDSGTGLLNSRHHKAGKVVLCTPCVGLEAAHLPLIRWSLSPVPKQVVKEVPPRR